MPVFRAAIRLAAPAAIALTAVVAAACAAPAGAVNPTASPATDGDQVVIRVDWEGGFVPPSVTLSRLPILLVTADGRLITQGPQVEIWPGPLMPNLQVRTLTPEALAGLLDLAKEKGLLADASYDFPLIADAATTVLRITVDGETHAVSAYALAEAGTDAEAGLSAADLEGRAALRSFIDAITGLPDSAFSDEQRPYEASGLRVYASPFVPQPDADWMAVDWPLADLATAGEPVGDGSLGFRCQVVEGDDLATVLPLLEGANTATPFRSGGAEWTLTVRPLLPGERGC